MLPFKKMSPDDLNFITEDTSISALPEVIKQINKVEKSAQFFQELLDSYTLPGEEREKKFISFN